MREPERIGQHRTDLAGALRDLRAASGVTGETLAKRANMSQSKLSKIETGRVLPTALDVERLLQALDIDRVTREELLQLAHVANTEFRNFRADLRRGLHRNQETLASLEAGATLIRYFLPAMITGLLQTPEYAREILAQRLVNCGADYEPALAGRLSRQAVLYQTQKSFVLILTEAAVRWRICEPLAMAIQLDHIASLATLPNVQVGVIPTARRVTNPPLNGFVIYDDRLVTVETINGSLAFRDPRDIRYHEENFEFFKQHALLDEDAGRLLSSIAAEFRG